MSDRSHQDVSENGEKGRDQDTPPEYRLPPTLPALKACVLWGVARPLIVLPVCFLGYICLRLLLGAPVVPAYFCWLNLALILSLIGLVLEHFLRHRPRVHTEQVVDRSEVEARIQEARNVRPRLPVAEEGDQEPSAIDFPQLKENVDAEVQRLLSIGPQAWTKYQVHPLERLLIEFLPIHDLKARATSTLAELEDYAEGAAYSYDNRLYARWQTTIDEHINEIDSAAIHQQDSVADKLRADLRSLLEHVANYESNWAEGKTLVHGIRFCGSAAVFVFIILGLLGLLLPEDATCTSPTLGILNWGFLGSAGALTSALNALRDSNEVEVGNTRGFQVLWRTVLGAPLGFVAGILAFSALAGGLFTGGSTVPNLTNPQTTQFYLSITWAIAAGMGFQSMFQRVRTAVAS